MESKTDDRWRGHKKTHKITHTHTKRPTHCPTKRPTESDTKLMNQKTNLKSIPEEQFSPYRAVDYLTTPAEIAAYIEVAKEENDPALLAAVMEDIRQIKTVQHASKTRILP